MATYILLARFTRQGLQHIKASPGWLEEDKRLFRALGAELKQFYLVSGQYDIITIFEAPDDETVARLMLFLGSTGNLHTETLRAFPEDEYRQIVNELPEQPYWDAC